MVDFAKLRAQKKGKIAMDDAKWETVSYGEHDAICIDVLQFDAEKWSDKNKRTFTTKVVYIVWLVYPKDGAGNTIWDSSGQPFKIDRQFNPTMDPQNKYGCYQILKDWAGRDLTPQERQNVDLVELIGKPCKLIIESKQAKSSQTWYSVVTTAEPADKDTAWMNDLRAESYKARDYSFELKPRIPSQNQTQPAEENVWSPDAGPDDIPF